jgi:uncharacterized protein (TIGR00730 family)
MPKAPIQPELLARAPLAYENEEFINSPDGRLLRIIAEYQEPLARFRRERIEDTIVFFGSARFHEPNPYYIAARTLAREISLWARHIPGPRHRFVVTSGGGPGIMEAANRGAHDAGAKSIGLNIHLAHEQNPNPYVTPALNFEFHYFFMRKYWFAYLAKALVVFPGGFGTLDELFELLTLVQTNKLLNPITVILYGSDYWRSVLNFDFLAAQGAISPGDLALFQFAETPEQALILLRAHLEPHIPLTTHTHPDPSTAPSAEALLGPALARTTA